jgi:LmbE family N-acetylglucosaminyl deacetylase
MMPSKILIIAAHPDDEVLGCGGTMARLSKEGNEVYTLILGEGVTSRDDVRDRKKREEEIKNLKTDIFNANNLLGVKKVFTVDYPDNRFDTVPFLDVVKSIEKVKEEIKPDIVFTHYENDLNIDHTITFKAVLTATRPMAGETVKEIYSFEILSSTEWNFPITFSPNVFYDITDYVEQKYSSMQAYKTEIRPYPHPRSVEGIKTSAKNWGMKVGLKYAEAFYV